MTSLEKCLFRSSAHFFDWVVCFFVIELYKFLIYFGYGYLIGFIVCKDFLPFFFILFMVSFAVQKLISLIRSYLFIFALISIALGE